MKLLSFVLILGLLSPNLYAQLETNDLEWEALITEFNAIQNNPTIVSIYGVNCPPCRTHRDDIRDQIFGQCDNPDLRWLVIWFEDPGHPAVRNDAVSQALLTTDSRVTQWWYIEHQPNTAKNDSIAHLYGTASWLSCYSWDISMLYDVGVGWSGVNAPTADYCMSKSGCCNTYSISNFKFQVDQLDVCVADTTSVPVADFSADVTSGDAPLSVSFTDISTNVPDSWVWNLSGADPSSSTIQNPIVFYNTPGTFDVTLIATNNAGSNTMSRTSYITVTSSTGITEPKIEDRFTIVPNPSNGLFTIQTSSGTSTDLVVEVFDVMGKLVLREFMTTDKQELNLEDAPAGVYMLQIRGNETNYTAKLLKE
ncbi:MAG: T9SS type A sorting domain-containing protein [Bacteroidetes bacterium]|nr:T9SS type A sorting domain-containing protein [Bacteroidota bacterium]